MEKLTKPYDKQNTTNKSTKRRKGKTILGGENSKSPVVASSTANTRALNKASVSGVKEVRQSVVGDEAKGTEVRIQLKSTL